MHQSNPMKKLGRTVYKWAERFIHWPNGLQAGRTVQKLAERLISRMNGRSYNHFRTCGSLLSTVRVFQQALTVESDSWITPLVLLLLSLGNVSARYCWNGSMLIVSGSFILACFYNCTCESDWSVPIDCSQGPCSLVLLISHPAHVQARFLTVPAGLLPCFLTAQADLLTRFLTLHTPDWF